MIENYNVSKTPSNGEFVDVRKYVGVASVNVVAINPNNEKLRKFGWSIVEDAPEPTYVTDKTDANGKPIKNARVRFLVQIQDLDEKPIVPLDFWVRSEIAVNKTGDKAKIIDAYGRTAWGTKAEITAHKIPVYSSGEANISTPYKLCHQGEEELVNFLFRYLNVTPMQVFDRAKNAWVASKNPGKLTIDNWNALCNGDISELAQYISLQPDNCVKVVLGLRNTDDNRSYQTFLNSGYIGNGALPDRNSGEYPGARRLIDKFMDRYSSSDYTFSAEPVKEWTATATVVEEKSGTMFDEVGNFVADSSADDDLPFD